MKIVDRHVPGQQVPLERNVLESIRNHNYTLNQFLNDLGRINYGKPQGNPGRDWVFHTGEDLESARRASGAGTGPNDYYHYRGYGVSKYRRIISELKGRAEGHSVEVESGFARAGEKARFAVEEHSRVKKSASMLGAADAAELVASMLFLREHNAFDSGYMDKADREHDGGLLDYALRLFEPVAKGYHPAYERDGMVHVFESRKSLPQPVNVALAMAARKLDAMFFPRRDP